MNKLRRALGDSAENPRYIETVAGRGYRFIGAVEHRLYAPVASIPAPILDSKLPAHRDGIHVRGHQLTSRVKPWIVLAVFATSFGIWGVVTLLTTKAGSVARPVLQFTIPPPPGTIFAPPISRQPFAISPDGTRLSFTSFFQRGRQDPLLPSAASLAEFRPGALAHERGVRQE